MFNIIIVTISALIPIGLIVFYYFITRSTEKPVRRDEKISNDDNTDKQKH